MYVYCTTGLSLASVCQACYIMLLTNVHVNVVLLDVCSVITNRLPVCLCQ